MGRVKLVVKWLYRTHCQDQVACFGCQAVFDGSDKWLSHLQLEKNNGCWPALWVKFLTDCDMVGDDENRARMLIFGILGLDENV